MRDELNILFDMFKDKKIDIIELQNRMSTLVYDSNVETEMIKMLDNKLEEIIYCYNPNNQYIEALNIITKFQQLTDEEII